MLGWGRRKDAQAVEAMREQLAAADMHARSVLAAVAQTDSRWSRDREERARAQLATAGALEEVRASAAENTADITRALHHVAEMCGQVVERLDADRVERRALTDAINLLARQQQASPLETPSQVLGGMVIAAPEADQPRNGDVARNGELALNGNGNGNGNGTSNGGYAHADEINLADYEEPPLSPFGTIEASRPAEPFRAVEVVEPVRTAEPAPPVPRVGTWDAVPPAAPGCRRSARSRRGRSRRARRRTGADRRARADRRAAAIVRRVRRPAPAAARRAGRAPTVVEAAPSARHRRTASSGSGTTATGSPRATRSGPTAERG